MKQLSLDLRDEGIERAVSHANKKVSQWSAKALSLLKIYLITHRLAFQCEDFRNWCVGKLQEPPSLRAFGGVIQTAKREKIIKHVGYKAVSNPKAHLTPASIWLKC